MAVPGNGAGQKRKAVSQPTSRYMPKRRKTEIPIQDVATGGLNVNSFVKAREFEIKALEASMQKSRKGLMARAFQQLPRHMRRRTAAHNVKKVPRRLQKKAEREMRLDNTPTVTRRTKPISRKLRLRLETAKLLKRMNQSTKTIRAKRKEAKARAKEPDPEKKLDVARVPRLKKNKQASPPRATSKYKRRQVNKTWLPTHLWHSKRAHMTRPTEPLWRMAIPLRPTEKSYRSSHRAAGSRGCLAWDTSYMSTVACQGTDHTLMNMLTLLGFVCEGNAARQRKWKAGTRHAQGWLHHIDNGRAPISPASVIWVVKPTAEVTQDGKDADQTEMPDVSGSSANESSKKKKIKLDRRLFMRVHPSAFQQLWLELLQAAKMQKPQVLVEDLRFEIGSIEITGPGSTEALVGVLHPRHAPCQDSVERLWTLLAGLNNPAALPDRALLAIDIIDPRLQPHQKPIDSLGAQAGADKLNELIVSWPVDELQKTSSLSSHKARWIASTTLPSQKAINRRNTEAGKGKVVEILDKDPAIPCMLLATRTQSAEGNAQGSWTVMLPWGCVDAVWRMLMRHPLSSGGTPRFGGLLQSQQLAFESLTPWYPGDFPATEAGKAWERSEADNRFDEWTRRPPSRRLAWNMVELGLGRMGELGRGWTCDWEYLFMDAKSNEEIRDPLMTATKANSRSATTGALGRGQRPPPGKRESKAAPDPRRRRNTSSPESDAEPDPPVEASEPPILFFQVTPSQAPSLFVKPCPMTPSTTPKLATIRIRLLTKGVPKPTARIYRLPRVRPASFDASSITVPSQPLTHPPNSNHTASSESAPPPGQPSPSTPTTTDPATSHPPTLDSLRAKWLSLLPPSLYRSTDPSNLPKHSKEKSNHRNLPPRSVTHAYDPPNHIYVLPPKAPQSIIDEFGYKPPTPAQAQQAAREALVKELMKNELKPGDVWDVSKGLIECPDEGDLIGFITSGGYNLAEGKGTAIAGIWVQRVTQGWRNEERSILATVNGVADRSPIEPAIERPTKAQSSSLVKHQDQKARLQERHLCVVRNAGESVGRLGIWELCQ